MSWADLQTAGRTRLIDTYRDSDADHERRRKVRFCGDLSHHCAHCDSVDNLDRHGPGHRAGYHLMEYTDEKTSQDPSIRPTVLRLTGVNHYYDTNSICQQI